MSSLIFTTDLSSSNRKNGEWLLGYYFRSSKLSKPPFYPVTSFKGMLDYLNLNYPTYVEYLGSLLKTMPSSDLIKVMEKVAARGLTDYPRPAYFASEIIDNNVVRTSEVLSGVASEIGSDVLAFFDIFSKVVIFGAIAYGVFWASKKWKQ